MPITFLRYEGHYHKHMYSHPKPAHYTHPSLFNEHPFNLRYSRLFFFSSFFSYIFFFYLDAHIYVCLFLIVSHEYCVIFSRIVLQILLYIRYTYIHYFLFCFVKHRICLVIQKLHFFFLTCSSGKSQHTGLKQQCRV